MDGDVMAGFGQMPNRQNLYRDPTSAFLPAAFLAFGP
jgi:hypothetical protein